MDLLLKRLDDLHARFLDVMRRQRLCIRCPGLQEFRCNWITPTTERARSPSLEDHFSLPPLLQGWRRRLHCALQAKVRQHRICTDSIIALNVLLFFASRLTSHRLLLLGTKVNSRIRAGELWRLVTPIALHASLPHLLSNAFSLSSLGPPAERLLGARTFLLTYAFSGVAGTTASFLASPHPSLGASGAIFGLAGAMVMALYRQRQAGGTPGADVELANMGVSLALSLVASAGVPQVDHWAHVGGLAGGATASWILHPAIPLAPSLSGGAPASSNHLSRNRKRRHSHFSLEGMGQRKDEWWNAK